MEVVEPRHTVVAVGFAVPGILAIVTVTSMLNGFPGQPLAVGVTVYLTTPLEVTDELVSVWEIVFPHPDMQSLNPVMVPPVGGVRMAAVQVNVVPATGELNVMFVGSPPQILWLGGLAVPVGFGFTAMVND